MELVLENLSCSGGWWFLRAPSGCSDPVQDGAGCIICLSVPPSCKGRAYSLEPLAVPLGKGIARLWYWSAFVLVPGCCGLRVDLEAWDADVGVCICRKGSSVANASRAPSLRTRSASIRHALSHVDLLMYECNRRCSTPNTIPEIFDCSTFGQAELATAREDPVVRKTILRRYRWEVVRPCLIEYDRRAYVHAAKKRLDVFGLTVESLQPVPGCLCADLLVSAWCAQSWKWFRCWAIIRTTGFWPLTVYGESVLPLVLPRCSACGAQHVTVAHALADCPHTATDYLLLSSIAVDMPDRECTPIFFQSLLGECLLLSELEARIRYVGTAVHTVVFGDTVGW